VVIMGHEEEDVS